MASQTEQFEIGGPVPLELVTRDGTRSTVQSAHDRLTFNDGTLNGTGGVVAVFDEGARWRTANGSDVYETMIAEPTR
jgi:hypothetical protein